MGYQVEVDKDVCMSSGKCVADAPSAFQFDEDELSEPTAGAAELGDERLLAIARNCPSGAIRLLDGGAEVPLY